MLRIAQLTETFLPVMDGVGRVALAYAETMCKMGHQVTVIAPTYDTGYRGGFAFELLDFCGVTVPGNRQYKTGEAKLDPHYRQRIKMIDLDIVHSHSPFMAGMEAMRLAQQRNIPLVSTFHSKYYDDFLKATKSERMAQWGVKHIVNFYERCDDVWVVGKETANVLYGYGYRGDIHVMPNGAYLRTPKAEQMALAEEKFNLPPEETLLLFVGQMNWKKNIRLVLESCAGLRKEGMRFTLLLAGCGPDEKEIDQKISELGLENCARRIGHQTDTQVLDGLYQRASLLVFPSLYDNAPMVVREAAAMETPAVMVKGSSAAEVIRDGINGFLCQNDADDLKCVIQTALRDQNRLKEIGQNARSTIPISWDTIMENALSRYAYLVQAKREGKRTKTWE